MIRDCTLCLRKEHEANHSGSKSVFSNRETPPFDAEILYQLINYPISHELDEISYQPVDDSLDPGLAVSINNNENKLMEITNVAFGRFFYNRFDCETHFSKSSQNLVFVIAVVLLAEIPQIYLEIIFLFVYFFLCSSLLRE